MTTTAPTKPDPVIPPQLETPATWVPLLHTAVAAVLAIAAFVLPGSQPAWIAPVFLLVAALVFVVGIALYLWHRDHWTKASLETIAQWAWTSVVPQLSGDVAAIKAAVPADIASRITTVESKVSAVTAQLPALRSAAEALRALVAPSQAPSSAITPVAAPQVPSASPSAPPAAVESPVWPAAATTLP